MHALLTRYVERGWALVRLHPGTPIPVDPQWSRRPLRDWAAITDAFHLDDPSANGSTPNVGIATGYASGVWALDVDPRHDGPATMARLIAEHGPLPATYTVRTPGGGWHHYFLMPDDGLDIRNSNGDTNRLGRGVDVRGSGGQVAAPPSTRPDGDYVLELDVPVAPAPAWLIELVRGRPRTEPVAPPADISLALAPANSAEMDRVRRYAHAAATAELGRLAGAGEGGRNQAAFNTACALNELLNSPWSGLDPAQVYAAYMQACDTNGLSVDTPAGQPDDCWVKGTKRVAGRGRAYPGLGDLRLDFSEAAPGEVVREAPGGDVNAPVNPLRARLLTRSTLELVPPLDPLVDGYLWRDSLAWLIGKSGEGKSFVAVDLVMCLAAGRDWHGADVKAGRSLYVMAEGARGALARVRAWEKLYLGGQRIGEDALHVYPDPVQAGDAAAWANLVDLIATERYDLVVLDTQARMTVGMAENDNSEMGLFVERADDLRRAAGSCVVVVHHLGHTGANARGASALKGAAQTELTVSKAGTRISVATSKQKDADELAPVWLKLQPVDLGAFERPGAALVRWVADSASLAAELGAELSTSQNLLVACFAEVFAMGLGGTKAEVKTDFLARGGTVRSFMRAWGWAVERGMIAKVEGRDSWRWVPQEVRT